MAFQIVLRPTRITQTTVEFALPQEVSYRIKLVELLKKCFDRGAMCTFALNRPRRSTGDKSQNHHLNGHIIQIMREMGMTTKKEYDPVKTEIKRIAHVAFGYPALDKNAHFFKSEADCDTQECAWLIEAAHLLAGDLGIVLIENF